MQMYAHVMTSNTKGSYTIILKLKSIRAYSHNIIY